MEHLSNALQAVFAHQDGDEILVRANILNSEREYPQPEYLYKETSESMLMKLLHNVNVYSTIDQKSILMQVFQSKWTQPDYSIPSLKFTDEATVFNALLHFGLGTLAIKDHEPICRYHRLLRWHSLTTILGEDLLTTSYLASRDLSTGTERSSFCWDAIIGHDNTELNAIFARPIADVHMHLKGSSFNFDLSWISLMNNFIETGPVFDKLNQEYKDSYEWDQKIYSKIQRAAVIRYYLSGILGLCDKTLTTADIDLIFNKNSKNSIDEKVNDELQKVLLSRNYNYVEKLIDERNEKIKDLQFLPYEYIANGKHPGTQKEYQMASILASERKFLYSCFKKIFSEQKIDNESATLFYAYLSYKSAFRQQILQLDEQVGFKNFSKYENRKDIFIHKKYGTILYSAAICNVLNESPNRFLETRIAPQDTPEALKNKIADIVLSVNGYTRDKDNLLKRLGIIIHFIKSRDNSDERIYRHSELSEKIKQQCIVICKFRNDKSNWDKNPYAGLVVGIDAANSEIMCRPEVYGQAYRFLRYQSGIETAECPNDLRFTFHVGEDFLDIADGLRAVEEAVLFLGLRHGDRIGHGLVLGTDVAKYYEMRYFTICASKQVILDNAAWLYHKCRRLGGSLKLLEYFECVFRKYFNEVFCDSNIKSKQEYYDFLDESDDNPDFYSQIKRIGNIEDYYLSWLLRGNHPKFGVEISKILDNEISDSLEKLWIESSINQHPSAKMALYNSNARELFDAYHRNDIILRGDEADTMMIPESMRAEFIELLVKIQEQLLDKLEHKRIAIECNPTSNYKIGELEQYDQHPIFKFYNKGLNTPFKQHNLLISINTDDLGVFSTSLNREYSLIALSAERRFCKDDKNTPRMITDWLDNIRKMSIEQLFINFKDINNLI